MEEKTVSFWFRTALRIMSWTVLMFYMIFRIIIPVIEKERLTLDQNDGYVMGGCLSLILSIEAVKYAFDKWIAKKGE